jgi:hypothetical protein
MISRDYDLASNTEPRRADCSQPIQVGFENFRLHLTMTGAVAAALALVVVLIVDLDWPFRGEVSVSPEAYVNVEHGWNPASGGNGERSASSG